MNNKFQSYRIVFVDRTSSASARRPGNNVIDIVKCTRREIALVYAVSSTTGSVIVDHASRHNFEQSKIHFRYGRIAALTTLEPESLEEHESRSCATSTDRPTERGKGQRFGIGRVSCFFPSRATDLVPFDLENPRLWSIYPPGRGHWSTRAIFSFDSSILRLGYSETINRFPLA